MKLKTRIGRKPQSYLSEYPDLVSELHPTKNGIIDTNEIAAGGSIKLWWHKKECGHTWIASHADRKSGRGCAVCHGKQVDPEHNSLQAVRPDIAAEWHPTKNNKSPTKVTWASHQQIKSMDTCRPQPRYYPPVYQNEQDDGL